LVFALLVAIGVVGRLGQPEWCFTPIAAAAVFAGFYFSRLAIAALVPIAILTISDLVLPSYNNLPVMLLTYAAMTFPAWFGRMLRGEHRGWGLAGRWVLCGLAPATLFFVVSNSAVWAFQSDYEQSLSGLTQCYIAALPFYRAMLAGDVFYMTVLFACWALSGIRISAPRPVPERVRCESNQRD
jgi:uncharacterized PurR-regulated membrane protein YhhQ (DUF165 family)